MHIFLIYKKGPLWCGWSCSWIAGHCKVTVSRRMRGVLVWSLCYIREGNGTPLQYPCLEIPWTEEPGRLQFMGSLRVRHDWATSLSLFTFHFHAMGKEMAIHSSVLAWRNPGTAEPGGLPFMGSRRVGHNWSNLAAAAAVPIMKRTSQCKSKPQWGVNSHHSEWPLLNKQTKKICK